MFWDDPSGIINFYVFPLITLDGMIGGNFRIICQIDLNKNIRNANTMKEQKGAQQMIGAIMTKKAVRSAFDALDKGDVEKMLKHWNEDCTFFYPGKVRAGGLYKGKSQLKNWLEEFFKQFPQRKYTIKHIGVDNIFDMLGNNTVFVCFELELINKDGMHAANSGISMITIKGAKAVKEEIFLKVTDGEEYKRSWGDIH